MITNFKIFESNNNQEFFDLLCNEAECEDYHRDYKSANIDLIKKYIFEKKVDINGIVKSGNDYNYTGTFENIYYLYETYF